MGWTINLLNIKVLILLSILVAFLALAIMLILLEFRLKERKKKKFSEQIENARIIKLKKDFKSTKTPKERLKVIDQNAKSLLKDRFELPKSLSYSELIPILKGKKSYEYASFCQKMFNVYYTNKEINNDIIKELLKDLSHLIRETEVYLDPENYNSNTILPSEEKQKEQPLVAEKDIQNVRKTEKLLKQKESTLLDKQILLKEKQKMIRDKEKEISKKEKSSQRLLKELERKINEQEQKINEQEELQKQIEQKLKQDKSQKIKIQIDTTRNDQLKKDLKEEEDEIETQKNWREDIDVDTVIGKEWLKKRSKRKRK